MINLTKKTIKEDLSLLEPSPLLWELSNNKPEIRQIYGHFLPPFHRGLGKGLVAKDFNFPPAAHDASGLCSSDELYEIGGNISSETIISLNDSVKIRPEAAGAIFYTPYFNGFYMNETAYKIIKLCADKVKIGDIAIQLVIDLDTVLTFVARVLTLGIVNVYHF